MEVFSEAQLFLICGTESDTCLGVCVWVSVCDSVFGGAHIRGGAVFVEVFSETQSGAELWPGL